MSDTILAYEDYAQEPVSALYGPSDLPYRDYVSWLHEQTQGTAAPPDPATGTAWVATVDAGRWVAQCIRCQAGMVVTPTDPVTLCPLCPTGWAPVEFPSTQRRAFIERELLQIPGWRLSAPAREWTPTMTNLQLRERVVRALEVAATLQPGEQVRALSIGAARVWTVGEILTAANENTHISDVLDDLAGRNGPIELEDSLEVADGTGRFLGMPKGATTTRPAHGAGRARFNTTKGLPEFSDGSAWREMGNAPELTYETLNAANDVGTGATQVSRGNHTHLPSVPSPSVAAVSGETDRLAVSWAAPFAGSSAITGYTVGYSRAGANSWTEVAVAGTSTSRTLTGLRPNTRYDVRVRATNIVGAGGWSQPVSATTNDGRMYAAITTDNNTPVKASLVILDTGTPSVSSISGQLTTTTPPSSPFFRGGLAFINGTLYVVVGTTLYSVDTMTGIYTRIAATTSAPFNGSAYCRGAGGTNSKMYAAYLKSNSNGNTVVSTGLYELNLSGGGSQISSTTQTGTWNNCRGLAGEGNTLYALLTTRLYTVNTSTGAVTAVGATFSGSYRGLASDGTSLYTTIGSSLYSIPFTGGAPSLIGSSNDLNTRLLLGAFVPA